MLAAIPIPPDPGEEWERERWSGKRKQADWLWLEDLAFTDDTNHLTMWTYYLGHSRCLKRGLFKWGVLMLELRQLYGRSISERALAAATWEDKLLWDNHAKKACVDAPVRSPREALPENQHQFPAMWMSSQSIRASRGLWAQQTSDCNPMKTPREDHQADSFPFPHPQNGEKNKMVVLNC